MNAIVSFLIREAYRTLRQSLTAVTAEFKSPHSREHVNFTYQQLAEGECLHNSEAVFCRVLVCGLSL